MATNSKQLFGVIQDIIRQIKTSTIRTMMGPWWWILCGFTVCITSYEAPKPIICSCNHQNTGNMKEKIWRRDERTRKEKIKNFAKFSQTSSNPPQHQASSTACFSSVLFQEQVFHLAKRMQHQGSKLGKQFTHISYILFEWSPVAILQLPGKF